MEAAQIADYRLVLAGAVADSSKIVVSVNEQWKCTGKCSWGEGLRLGGIWQPWEGFCRVEVIWILHQTCTSLVTCALYVEKLSCFFLRGFLSVKRYRFRAMRANSLLSSLCPVVAERCRSLLVPEDSGVDVENGGKRTIPRSRNGMLGEDMDDAAPLDSGVSMSDMQMGSFSTLKAVKRAEVGGTGPKVGRPRKLSVYNPRGLSCIIELLKLNAEVLCRDERRHLPFTVDDLDIMCGVPSPRSGAPCRQPLTCKSHSISSKRAVTGRRKPFDALLQDFKDNNSRKSQQDIPRPLATKVYCSGHSQRMRAVITSLYRESISGRSSLPQNEQTLALDANPQQQQQQHALMSLNKVRTTEGGDKVEVVLYAAAHLPAFTARRLSGMGVLGGDAHVPIGSQVSPGSVVVTNNESFGHRKLLKGVDFLVRIKAFAFCLAVIVLLKNNVQTTVIAPGIVLQAKYNNTKAPVSLLVLASICCGYAFLQAVVSLLSFIRDKRVLNNTVLAWLTFLLDQVLTYLLLGSAAATAEAAYIAKRGEDKVQWKAVCGPFKRFCDHFAATVFLSFIAVIAFAVSAAISAYYLFRRSKGFNLQQTMEAAAV
ncbi:hypothetical protein SELMODRAFT_431321 [Selaginella moellendorffii]|nr:hypothetical protein SELMODRAFT_431321 [Selaginella moellendorffii]